MHLPTWEATAQVLCGQAVAVPFEDKVTFHSPLDTSRRSLPVLKMRPEFQVYPARHFPPALVLTQLQPSELHP